MEGKSSNYSEKGRYWIEKEINPEFIRFNRQEKTINWRTKAATSISQGKPGNFQQSQTKIKRCWEKMIFRFLNS